MHLVFFYAFCMGTAFVECLPDQGIWDFSITKPDEYVQVTKSLYNGSDIIIKITCTGDDASITVGWILRESPCWHAYIGLDSQAGRDSDLASIYHVTKEESRVSPRPDNSSWFHVFPGHTASCDKFVLPDVTEDGKSGQTAAAAKPAGGAGASPNTPAAAADVQSSPKAQASKEGGSDPAPAHAGGGGSPAAPASDGGQGKSAGSAVTGKKAPKAKALTRSVRAATPPKPHRQYSVSADGVYLLIVNVSRAAQSARPPNVTVHIEMRADYGYLSAADWPNLPFYAVMCAVYVLYGLGWLLVCACQWRELLRIQFWIGGVIAMGMLEKAMFLAEYESVNRTGHSVRGAVVAAEIVSCAKRALARMLVIIVSLGFGITKPRLGPLLHRVMAVGMLFFMAASVESCTRALRPKNDFSGGNMSTSVVLALLDSGICWWVFSALLNTTRTLRLRRNEVKLTLYRHFTNTLILAVLASVGFMVWTVRFHRSATCLRQWKNLWADEACWHVLFSMILLVIMLLWRPTNNNQRYAFTPLLDTGDEDEEDELFRSDAYHDLKMRSRGQGSPNDSRNRRSRHNSDEDLKWVEENIPSTMDAPLPAMDSDEEVMQAKFEISKMQ